MLSQSYPRMLVHVCSFLGYYTHRIPLTRHHPDFPSSTTPNFNFFLKTPWIWVDISTIGPTVDLLRKQLSRHESPCFLLQSMKKWQFSPNSSFSNPWVGPCLGNSCMGPLDGPSGFPGCGLQHRAACGSQDAAGVRCGEYWGDGVGCGGCIDVVEQCATPGNG